MAIPTPQEIVEEHGQQSPEALAHSMGVPVTRLELAPVLPGVTVLSEYLPNSAIILYQQAIRQAAEQRREPRERLEQWLIAHELYHALMEAMPAAAWRVRETDADMWADELISLISAGRSGKKHHVTDGQP